jgi:hypothetical protein|tara:strand:- start:867 stop:1100 length:234 start_codon:yes stop_codon:yes gene_type:complete
MARLEYNEDMTELNSDLSDVYFCAMSIKQTLIDNDLMHLKAVEFEDSDDDERISNMIDGVIWFLEGLKGTDIERRVR